MHTNRRLVRLVRLQILCGGCCKREHAFSIDQMCAFGAHSVPSSCVNSVHDFDSLKRVNREQLDNRPPVCCSTRSSAATERDHYDQYTAIHIYPFYAQRTRPNGLSARSPPRSAHARSRIYNSPTCVCVRAHAQPKCIPCDRRGPATLTLTDDNDDNDDGGRRSQRQQPICSEDDIF